MYSDHCSLHPAIDSLDLHQVVLVNTLEVSARVARGVM